jgi:AbrB family looped-hinge helix DNA binding protein
MPTVKVGLRKQIVLPTEICAKVGIVIGDYLDIETQEDGKIVMTPKMLEEQVIDEIEDKESFWEMVDELRNRFRDLSDEQAQAMVDRAVAAAKAEELEEIKSKRKTL